MEVRHHTHKTLTNFLDTDTNNDKRPFTHFNFENTIVTPTTDTLKDFYNTRKYEDQVVTEGNLEYSNYDKSWFTPTQTTSMLNTPYFINAIQQGVFNFRYKQADQSPYRTAAYLFLNSLPLGTLREKYKTSANGAVSDLDYILATLKKFGAVHKLPYAWILKYGSIWNRYKVYKKTGKDILDPVWTNFNYLENWDPVNSAATKSFNLLIDGTQRDIVLENTTTGSQPFTDINTGFYPQLTDDFNVFLQGLKLFSGQTQVTGKCEVTPISGDCTIFTVSGTCSLNGNVLTVTSISDNLIKPSLPIVIPSLTLTTSVLSQTSGVVGGAGTYVMPVAITATNVNFVIKSYANITNLTSTGITSGTIIGGPSTNGTLTLGVQISGTTNGNGLYYITPTSALTSSFTVLNPPLKVTAIDSNILAANSVLNGASLNGNVTILSQLSGINGGTGTYSISTGQTATTSNFVVANAFLQGVIENALKKSFAPEFLNRIDDIIIFEPLERDSIHKIIDIELSYLLERIKKMGFTLSITSKAKDFIVEKGWDAQFGARPLKRAIQRYVEDIVAEEIIKTKLIQDDVITVDFIVRSGCYPH